MMATAEPMFGLRQRRASPTDLVGERKEQVDHVDDVFSAERHGRVGREHRRGTAGVLHADLELIEVEGHGLTVANICSIDKRRGLL